MSERRHLTALTRVLILIFLAATSGWSTQVYTFYANTTPTGTGAVPVNSEAQVTLYNAGDNSVHIFIELINAYNGGRTSEAANINGFGMKFGTGQVVNLTSYALTSGTTDRVFYSSLPASCPSGVKGTGSATNPYYCDTGYSAMSWVVTGSGSITLNSGVNPIDLYFNDPNSPTWSSHKDMVLFLPNGGGTNYDVNGNQYDNSSFNPFYATKSTTFQGMNTSNPWADIRLDPSVNFGLNAETLQITSALFTFGSNSGIQTNNTSSTYTFIAPEPSTIAMFGGGLGLLLIGVFRRRKQL